MLAKQLSHILANLCRKSDVVTDNAADMDQRFESLRNYGRLPQGRENRGRPLTDDQIVTAVLGLVSAQPGWAGHVAAIMQNLRPVGGLTDAFGGATNLIKALAHLLSDGAARESIVAVRLSAAEAGTNSNGRAVFTYDLNGTRQKLSFVSNNAVTLMQPAAVAGFDSELRHAPVSRELVLNRRFFERLTQAVTEAREYPLPPIGDGSEYDKHDAEMARRKRLGATPSSRFLNIGVDNQVTWPREETLVEFDRYKLVLMPKTAEHVQSVHIDLHGNKLTNEEAMTVINRFLSLMTWCDDQFAIAQHGWSGNSIPVAVPKRNLAFTTTYQWVFSRSLPASDEQRRALALYREARNAEQNFMISYAVLNYYKVIEIRHNGPAASKKWVAENLPTILNDPRDQHGIDTFLAACGQDRPEAYIYTACRVAVAHASHKHPSDPDDLVELRRLHNAADVMRRLARRFITLELGVSERPF